LIDATVSRITKPLGDILKLFLKIKNNEHKRFIIV
jgi:hypothetical protein